MKTIIYSSNKGGVGKSSIALNVSGGLGLKGKVLFIGLDGQKNSSGILAKEKTSNSIYEVLQGKVKLQDAIYESQFKNVWYVPESRKLDNASVDKLAIKKLLQPLIGTFSHVIIDCPPALSSVVYSAYTSATMVVIPTELDRFSSSNIVTVINTIEHLNRDANIVVLPNKIVGNSKLHRKVKGELEQFIKTKDNVSLGNSLPQRIEITNQMFEGKLLILSNKINQLKTELKKHVKDVR